MNSRSRFIRQHDRENRATFDFDQHMGQYAARPSQTEIDIGKKLDRLVVVACKFWEAVRRFFTDP